MKTLLAILVLILAINCPAPISFDGVDDVVTTANLTSIKSLGAFSISLWCLRTSIASDHGLCGQYNTGDGPLLQSGNGLGGKTNILWWLKGDAIYTTDGAFKDTGVWYHICVTFQTNSTPRFKIYLNGVLATSTANYGSPNTTANTGSDSGSFTIGSTGSGLLRPFAGQIAEFRMFNVDLTLAEVQNLALSRLLNFQQMRGEIAYYPMNEWPDGTAVSGLYVADRVGGVPGVVSGGASAVAKGNAVLSSR